ncbi:voltage-dependent calcium channel subunit alpha-2/delta-3-like [Asterias amurensis]|uniref:voltage-dependent calcium channel subunit alpha-2/delta-3-like n=1 Tax=Asterias amurensis TaxID=7602 RepID=UPI003AB38B92
MDAFRMIKTSRKLTTKCLFYKFSSIIFYLYVFLILVVSKHSEGQLSNFLGDVENEINKLTSKTLQLYRDRCSESLVDCSSAFEKNGFACSTSDIQGEDSLCRTDHGTAFSTAQPGCSQCTNRRLNEELSLVRTASSHCTCKDLLSADICWTKGLEDDLKRTSLPGLLWQQISTTNGFTRLYPGTAEETCYSYDPRLRSWFVAASTGPKDVVIVVDSSASMDLVPKSSTKNMSLMQLAIQAVTHVLSTLTFMDYVAVTKFSTESEQVTVNEVFTLIQATRENISALTTEVNKIQPSGHTNFEQAFRLAFNILDRSTSIGRTTGCSKAILFLTDGSPTRGESDPTRLAQIVGDLNTRQDGSKIASIFTYSISDIAETEISKHIACSANGIWSQVETDSAASLQEQISQYFEFYSTLHKGPSSVIWTEPYLDAFGADMVVTAAKAVYDNSNTSHSKLVAVVSIDISYEHIQQLDSDKEVVREELRRHQDFCPEIAVYSQCELEVLRQKIYANGAINYQSDLKKICDQSSTCPLPSNESCPNRTFQYEQCTAHTSATRDYQDAACCGMFLPCPSSNVPSVRLSPILTAVFTCLLLAVVTFLL